MVYCKKTTYVFSLFSWRHDPLTIAYWSCKQGVCWTKLFPFVICFTEILWNRLDMTSADIVHFVSQKHLLLVKSYNVLVQCFRLPFHNDVCHWGVSFAEQEYWSYANHRLPKCHPHARNQDLRLPILNL